MDDERFPQSEESADARSARAVAALQYEQEAGLGFRRRERSDRHQGDPYAEPDEYLVGRPDTAGSLVCGYLGAIAVMFGIFSFAAKPLLFAPLGIAFALGGLLGDHRSQKIAKAGFIVIGFGFVLGMIFCLLYNTAVI